MTKEHALKELEKILDEYNEKADSIRTEAQKNGTWLPGLDSNNALFKEIQRERNEKIQQLLSVKNKE